MMKRVSMFFLVAAVMLVLPACGGRESTQSMRDDADRATRFGQHGEAIDAYHGILDRLPQDRQAHRGLGEMSLATGDYRTARTHLAIAYQQALSHAPTAFEIAGLLADAMEGMGDDTAALIFLRERAETIGGTGDYLRWGKCAERQGDPDAAELAYRTAARLDAGQTVEPYLHLAMLYEGLGDTDSAVLRLRQAYGVNPTDSRVTNWLSRYVSVIGPSIALPADR